MDNFLSQGIFFLFSFLMIIPALTMHEWAHAWMANRLGDSTARMLGRMSIDPLRHIDLLGTVLVPIVLLVLSQGQFTFGWAKPVPFNPRNLKNPQRDTALVGIAGPVMNIILALGSGIVLLMFVLLVPEFIFNFSTQTGHITSLTIFGRVVGFFCYINLVLCFFNLLPIPPFDGSRIIQKFLRGTVRDIYHQIEPYGMWIVLGLVWVLPMLTGFNVIGMYFSVTAWPVFEFLTRIPVGLLFTPLF